MMMGWEQFEVEHIVTFTVINFVVKFDGVMIVLCKSVSVESSGKWVASRWDRAVCRSVSWGRKLCRDTDDSLQLINARGHLSDAALKVAQ